MASHPDALKAAASMENSHPRIFKAAVEGFHGPSYSLELIGDKLEYRFNADGFAGADGSRVEELKIKDEDWLRFRHRLQESGCGRWKGEYVDRNTADGTLWRLEIVYPDSAVRAYGSNRVPSEKSFRDYEAAVTELLSGRPFK